MTRKYRDMSPDARRTKKGGVKARRLKRKRKQQQQRGDDRE